MVDAQPVIAATQNEGKSILMQNYPNPFQENTYVSYQLANDARINISIFNITGQLVATLIDGEQKSGAYQLQWNGRDAHNNSLANGIYFYRMIVERNGQIENIAKRMLLMR